MDEAAQKAFLEARFHYNKAVEAWELLGDQVSVFASAMSRPADHERGGWYRITVAGQSLSGRSDVSYGRNTPVLFADDWPTGTQIAQAWILCNEAFCALNEAFAALPPEDREYLQVQTPHVLSS